MPYQSPFNAIVNTAGKTRSMFGITDTESVDAPSASKAVGQFLLNASDYRATDTFRFQSTFHVSSGALTGTVVLYNLTDGEVVSSFTTSSTSPQNQQAVLTVGAGVGDLKPSNKIYEFRMAVSGTLASDLLSVGSAILAIN